MNDADLYAKGMCTQNINEWLNPSFGLFAMLCDSLVRMPRFGISALFWDTAMSVTPPALHVYRLLHVFPALATAGSVGSGVGTAALAKPACAEHRGKRVTPARARAVDEVMPDIMWDKFELEKPCVRRIQPDRAARAGRPD